MMLLVYLMTMPSYGVFHVIFILLKSTGIMHKFQHACVGVDEQQEPCGDGEGGWDHPLLLFLATLAHHPLKANLLQP
jgi:hypothetical protein